jgi:hypothetical protein
MDKDSVSTTTRLPSNQIKDEMILFIATSIHRHEGIRPRQCAVYSFHFLLLCNKRGAIALLPLGLIDCFLVASRARHVVKFSPTAATTLGVVIRISPGCSVDMRFQATATR